MKRKKTAHSGKSTKLALFFGFLIVLLILSALAVKAILLFSRSAVDASHQYILQVNSSEASEIIAFNPDASSIIMTFWPKGTQAKALSIPNIANVRGETSQSPKTVMQYFLTHINSSTLNPIDVIKLWWIAMITPDTGISRETFTLPLSVKAGQDMNKLFVDQSMYHEGKSVEIQNAAEEVGLGNIFAQPLSRIGTNIIAVNTASKPVEKSEILYSGEKSYTLARLAKILHFPTRQVKGQRVADITIILGRDSVELGK